MTVRQQIEQMEAGREQPIIELTGLLRRHSLPANDKERFAALLAYAWRAVPEFFGDDREEAQWWAEWTHDLQFVLRLGGSRC
jgi:hypothetical protein